MAANALHERLLVNTETVKLQDWIGHTEAVDDAVHRVSTIAGVNEKRGRSGPLVGSRLLSAYRTLRGEKLWIITEAVGEDGRRASSCLLLPEEY